jgi:prevent-host-death family protein
MHNWQLQEAKARFSELVNRATSDGPQHITVHGKPAVVVLSEKEYNKLKSPKISFIEFINRSPIKGVKLDIKRDKSSNRDIEL